MLLWTCFPQVPCSASIFGLLVVAALQILQDASCIRTPHKKVLQLRSVELPMRCLQEYAQPLFCFPDSQAKLQMKIFLKSCLWSDARDKLDLTAYHIKPDGIPMVGSNPYDDISGRDYAPIAGGFTAQTCSDANGLAAVRIGPFNTTGGYRWTEIMAPIAHPEQIFGGKHGWGFAFQSYAVGSMTRSGRLIGHPPIHQHHFHFWGWGDHPTDVINIHGEQQCTNVEGGVDCYIKTLPRGFAYVITRVPLIIAMAFNDVRADGSSPMESWVLAATQALPPGEIFRQVTMLRIELRPLPVSSWTSRQTYSISVAVDSVTWDSGTLDTFHGYQTGPADWGGLFPSLPKNATIVEGSLHAHDNLMWDVLFFQGTPDSVFYNGTLAKRSKHRTEYGETSISRLMSNIRARMLLPNRAILACSFRTAEDRETVQFGDMRQTFVRLPRCNINPLKRAWVLIALHHNFGDYHSGRFHGSPENYQSWRNTARMHAYVRVYYAYADVFR